MFGRIQRLAFAGILGLVIALAGFPLGAVLGPSGYVAAHAYMGAKKRVIPYVAAKSVRSSSGVINRKLFEIGSTPKGKAALAQQFRRIVRADPGQRPLVLRKIGELKGALASGDRFSKAPYSARAMEARLFARYGEKAVKSSTLPPSHMPNVRNAGGSVNAAGQKVPFNNRGLPIFDKFSKFDTRLPNYDRSASNQVQFRSATRDLNDAINRGQIPKGTFDVRQMQAIQAGAPKVPGYTWHHHQDRGRFQLVPDAIHSGARHVGGRFLEK